MESALLNGVAIAEDIKQRCRDLKKHGVRLTVKRLFSESGVSYLTYKSWKGGRCEPRLRTVQKVDAVLKRYEGEAKDSV
jgi:hypothetical protein